MGCRCLVELDPGPDRCSIETICRDPVYHVIACIAGDFIDHCHQLLADLCGERLKGLFALAQASDVDSFGPALTTQSPRH